MASEKPKKPQALEFRPGPDEGLLLDIEGKVHRVPKGWEHLPPGDALLTRRVKAATETWTLKVWRKRRLNSLGLWADAKVIDEVRNALEAERATPSYEKRLEASRRRSAKQQVAYVEEFRAAILSFLDFPLQHQSLAEAIAAAVSNHATPVGSGTVARTERIPIANRARAAVIAWMRHATTSYDTMTVDHFDGGRREVRRRLAGQSIELLDRYRANRAPKPARCPIQRALREDGTWS